MCVQWHCLGYLTQPPLKKKDFLFVSDAHADTQATEVTLPEHTEERTQKSTSVTLQPFALLCKISKWMSAWRQKTSFDSKATLLSSEKVTVWLAATDGGPVY